MNKEFHIYVISKLNQMYDDFSENKFKNKSGKEFYYLSMPFNNKYPAELYMDVDLKNIYYKQNDTWITKDLIDFIEQTLSISEKEYMENVYIEYPISELESGPKQDIKKCAHLLENSNTSYQVENSKNSSKTLYKQFPVTEKIPMRLRQMKRWVLWAGNKIPICATTGAATGSEKDWYDYDFVYNKLKQDNLKKYSGMGFFFKEGDGIVGIDIDNCIVDGQIDDFANEIIEKFNGYTEITPSQTGVHIIVLGDVESAFKKSNVYKHIGLEIYKTGRYFTFTGNRINVGVARDRTAELKQLIDRFKPKNNDIQKMNYKCNTLTGSDADVITLVENSKYYNNILNEPDLSDRDFYYAQLLAYFTKKDIHQMERIFRNSVFMYGHTKKKMVRGKIVDTGIEYNKFDSPRGNSTWGMITLQKACETQHKVYEGSYSKGK